RELSPPGGARLLDQGERDNAERIGLFRAGMNHHRGARMAADGGQRPEMRMRQINEPGLVFPGIDMKLEFALNPQARSDDLTPDTGKDARGKIAPMPRDQTAQNGR